MLSAAISPLGIKAACYCCCKLERLLARHASVSGGCGWHGGRRQFCGEDGGGGTAAPVHAVGVGEGHDRQPQQPALRSPRVLHLQRPCLPQVTPFLYRDRLGVGGWVGGAEGDKLALPGQLCVEVISGWRGQVCVCACMHECACVCAPQYRKADSPWSTGPWLQLLVWFGGWGGYGRAGSVEMCCWGVVCCMSVEVCCWGVVCCMSVEVCCWGVVCCMSVEVCCWGVVCCMSVEVCCWGVVCCLSVEVCGSLVGVLCVACQLKCVVGVLCVAVRSSRPSWRHRHTTKTSCSRRLWELDSLSSR